MNEPRQAKKCLRVLRNIKFQMCMLSYSDRLGVWLFLLNMRCANTQARLNLRCSLCSQTQNRLAWPNFIVVDKAVP